MVKWMSAPRKLIDQPRRYTCEVLDCKRVVLLLTLFVNYLFGVYRLARLEAISVEVFDQLISLLLANKDLLVVLSDVLFLFFLLLNELLGEPSLLL
jgi:hypothetical protein